MCGAKVSIIRQITSNLIIFKVFLVHIPERRQASVHPFPTTLKNKRFSVFPNPALYARTEPMTPL